MNYIDRLIERKFYVGLLLTLLISAAILLPSIYTADLSGSKKFQAVNATRISAPITATMFPPTHKIVPVLPTVTAIIIGVGTLARPTTPSVSAIPQTIMYPSIVPLPTPSIPTYQPRVLYSYHIQGKGSNIAWGGR